LVGFVLLYQRRLLLGFLDVSQLLFKLLNRLIDLHLLLVVLGLLFDTLLEDSHEGF
jgi:hypothetical protein